MKRKVITMILLAAALSLPACSTVPEEVSRDNEILNSVTPIDKNDLTKDNYECLSMEEIRNSIEETLSENNTNVLPGKVIVGNTDSMPVYKISPYNNNFNFSNIVKYLMDEQFTMERPNCFYYKKGEKSDDGSDTFSCDRVYYIGGKQINTAGLLAVEDGQMRFDTVPTDDPLGWAFIAPTEKRYRLKLGEDLDDASYRLLDGQEWSVKEAANFAVDFFQEYIAPLEKNEFTYAVTEFRVKNMGDGLAYVVNLQRLKDGSCIDNHYAYFNRSFSIDPATLQSRGEAWFEIGYPYLYNAEIQICFQEKEKVFSFLKCSAPYEGERIDRGEKLISLKSAIEIISANMADKSVQEFEYTELVDFYVAMDCKNYDSQTSMLVDNSLEMLNNSDIQLRPYWAFVKEDCWPDMQGGVGGSNEFAKYQHLYLVDAITGEFYLI